jgi:hypothetical protein
MADESDRPEPIAWRVYDTDGSEAVYCTGEEARAAAYDLNWSIEPLYRSPALTGAERQCLREVMDIYAGEDDVASNEIAAVIDNLLERTK